MEKRFLNDIRQTGFNFEDMPSPKPEELEIPSPDKNAEADHRIGLEAAMEKILEEGNYNMDAKRGRAFVSRVIMYYNEAKGNQLFKALKADKEIDDKYREFEAIVLDLMKGKGLRYFEESKPNPRNKIEKGIKDISAQKNTRHYLDDLDDRLEQESARIRMVL